MTDILVFLLNIVASTVMGLFTLRLWLQAVPMSYRHPLCQLVFKATAPIIGPLQQIIPWRSGINWASVVAIVLVGMVFSILYTLLIGHSLFNTVTYPALIAIWLLKICDWVINVVIWVLIAQVLASWIAPHSFLAPVLFQLTRPILRPVQQIIPLIGGRIDISPVIVVIILQMILMVIAKLMVYLLFSPFHMV